MLTQRANAWRLRRMEQKLDEVLRERREIVDRVEFKLEEEERIKQEEFARRHEARLHQLLNDENRPVGGAIKQPDLPWGGK